MKQQDGIGERDSSVVLSDPFKLTWLSDEYEWREDSGDAEEDDEEEVEDDEDEWMGDE